MTYNILFLTVDHIDPYRGGIQRVCHTLSTWFAKSHNVYLCSLEPGEDGDVDNRYTLPNRIEIDGEENYQYLHDVVVDNEIEIILNHSYIEPILSLASRLCEGCGAKIITTYHTSPLATLVTLRDDLESLKFRYPRRRALYQQIYHLTKYPYSYLCRRASLRVKLRHIYDRSDAVVLLSDSFRSDFVSLSGIEESSSLYSISNPTELSADAGSGGSRRRNQLLFVGRVTPQKRIDRLLRVWRRVQKYGWELIIVGDGEWLPTMMAYCAELSLERVIFAGQAEPHDYYERAKILCMTSSYEGFGMVLVEAQQAGCLPIAFRSFGSLSDIIEDGVNGLLITPFDEAEYAERLASIMQNEDRRLEMSTAAQQSVKRFSIERIGREWIELFDTLIR